MKRLGTFLALFMCAVLLFPAAATAKKISGPAAAKKLAKQKVKSAVVTEVDVDYENGGLLYEVTLIKGSREYNLKYRASDGKLMEYEWETEGIIKQYQSRKNLSKAKIKKKAKKQVKKAKINSVRLKYDDGLAEYKVKMKKGSKKYSLTYHAKTGKLLDYEWEIVKKSSSSKYIGVPKAKSIANKKVPGAQVVKVEYDKDDGIPVYEVEMIKGNMEYELKIHAKTGKILEYEQDMLD